MKLRSLVAAASIGLALASSGSSVAHAQGAPPPSGAAPAPDPAKVAIATAAFKKGTALFNQKKHNVAITEFQKSYDTVPSPNSLLYVARCQAELGQVKDAYRTFTKVIAEADARLPAEPKYQPTKDSATTEREELGKKLALLVVNVQNATDATHVKVGGSELAREEWGKPQPMDPGGIDVVIDGTELKKSATLEIGKKEVVELDAKPPEAPIATTTAPPPVDEDDGETSPLVPVGIAVAGVGVAGFVLFAITGSMSNGSYSDLEALCGGEQACSADKSAEAADLQDSGRTQQTLANVGLIVGAVGVAAGATLLIVGLTADDGGSGDETADAAPKPKTSVAFGPGSAMIKGTF